jgi:hypothetical protein
MVLQVQGFSCPTCHILWEIYHSSNEPFHCPECGQILYQPKENHMRTHSFNTFNIVYILFLLTLVIVFAALLFSRASAQAESTLTRYVSPWTVIDGHSAHSFQHGFGTNPLELNVWAMTAWVDRAKGIPVIAMPYLEFQGALQVTAVSHSVIVVQNNSDSALWVRVVARP